METETKETPVKGTLIYQPQGAAGEYAKWAINLYHGCSNGCTYCYNRRGVLSHAFGDKPELSAPIIETLDRQINYFIKIGKFSAHEAIPQVTIDNCTDAAIHSRIVSDVEKIGKSRLIEDGGVFMSFTCDPFDTEENVQHSTFVATISLLKKGIPVTLLTKNVEWLEDENWKKCLERYPRYYTDDDYLAPLTIGFTITGMDKLETHAPFTDERIETLRKIHNKYPDVKTFVSLEPMISIHLASEIIKETYQITDEIRIGAQSPIKKDRYDPNEFFGFIAAIKFLTRDLDCRFMVKDSMYKQAENFDDAYRDMCIAKLDEIREIYKLKRKEENHEK